ncbi:hypothetical protein IFM89_027159 [Coptis chinensis]|uniref:Uncharacterized protein n=1 Tax=Coptis chinensis TaxID=261450 RepID=A0A835HWS3_9MAGN|nr:hypothetical protein IFM89_027159 [Coptis chinensis]
MKKRLRKHDRDQKQNFDSLTLLACDTDALSFPLQEETSKTPVSKKGCVAFVGYMPGVGSSGKPDEANDLTYSRSVNQLMKIC